LQAFEQMDSALWVERARAELERTNVSPTHSGELTPSERRVAELVVTGMTTADVAAQLCVSAKTVEANLTRIYRKLDIHSRAELGGMLGPSSQQRLEGDAVSAVQRANQLDGPSGGIEGTTVE
jgi:DNA-binding NarL/FixJ family response regulator